ncbi:MAG: hypothetical protein AAF391_11770 [Bacteroidota bacterium]
MKTFNFLVLFCGFLSLAAQPNTEVYLFDLDLSNKKQPLTNPVNVSSNVGYDNQPSFWPDGKSLIYARTVNGQTEIARYFIKKGKTKTITKTLQGSEYSPTPMPDGRISSIRLDTTGLQLLYAYDSKGKSEILVPDLVIGYHAWIDEENLVSFVLGDTITMQMINTNTAKSQVIGKNIGRSLHKMPGKDSFSFVDKSIEPWTIRSMNPESGETAKIAITPDGAEDYCWTPSGRIIMGNLDQLSVWDNTYKVWMPLENLTQFGLSGITRISVSPRGDKIAIVVNQ